MTAWTIRGRALRTLRRLDKPRARLICFPHAGAGPSIFNDWPSLLPDDVEVIGVVYPGRECRSQERPSLTLARLVDEVSDEVAELGEAPVAFFGHSMGAYVAFEASRRLERSPSGPQHLFVSAAGAPHIPAPAPLHQLSLSEFFRALVRLNGFSPEILAERELIAHALPILRADFTACETHRFVVDAPMRCPITVLGGTRDMRVDLSRLEAWKHVAGVSFDLKMYEGDHFFLRPHRKDIVAHISTELRRIA